MIFRDRAGAAAHLLREMSAAGTTAQAEGIVAAIEDIGVAEAADSVTDFAVGAGTDPVLVAAKLVRLADPRTEADPDLLAAAVRHRWPMHPAPPRVR